MEKSVRVIPVSFKSLYLNSYADTVLILLTVIVCIYVYGTGITGIHWFCSGSGSTRAAATTALANTNSNTDLPSTLCIVFDNGKIQLSRGDDDASAEILDTGLSTINYCRWATKGNLLAIVGTVGGGMQSGLSSKGESTRGSTSTTNIVKFFDGHGRFIRSIRIPGEHISAVTWEGGDLRLALAVDSFIYFANIRHNYTWCYFLNTVVFSYPRSERTREVSDIYRYVAVIVV